MNDQLKIAALAGGVGGAKLADGLAQVLDPGSLTVIVNTGDDFDHFGLRICPDLDTVCYTLAGLANPDTGWGRAGESWTVINEVESLQGPTWFSLGDRDLATSLERTRLRNEGYTLTEITSRFCEAWQVPVRVLPMTDVDYPTLVITDEGELSFQEYFVKLKSEPDVRGFIFGESGPNPPTPEVILALQQADLIVICPSNPWVSIDPILSLSGLREILHQKTIVAVSPIIGGEAVKGPAAKMFRELSIDPTPASVAAHYAPVLTALVMDQVDDHLEETVRSERVDVLITDTIMKSRDDRARLAKETLDFSRRFISS